MGRAVPYYHFYSVRAGDPYHRPRLGKSNNHHWGHNNNEAIESYNTLRSVLESGQLTNDQQSKGNLTAGATSSEKERQRETKGKMSWENVTIP